MRKLSGYGPSLVVLATAALVLWLGPQAARQITYHQTRTRIIDARNAGTLSSVDDLVNVRGVSDRILADIRGLAVLGRA